jgi:hypothetical protein
MKKLLLGAAITVVAVLPALAGGGMDDGGETCKACPSWRSPASSNAPPVLGSANFLEDAPRLRVCHAVKERVGTHRNGHAVYQNHQVCG